MRNIKEKLYTWEFESYFGKMIAIASDNTLYLLLADSTENKEKFKKRIFDIYSGKIIEGRSKLSNRVEQEVNEYAKGKRRKFDIKLDAQGTDFQKTVWYCLLEIPYSDLTNYDSIAKKIGKEKASRAVGNAVGSNPIQIIIPCHRVIRKDKGLGGFAGGLEMKKKLLKIENSY